MRRIFIFLLVFCCFKGSAQDDSDAEALMVPRILAVDTSLSQANHFNDEIGKLAEGYSLAFTDKSRPKSVMQIYKTESNETLRLEYRYVTGEDDAADTKACGRFSKNNRRCNRHHTDIQLPL